LLRQFPSLAVDFVFFSYEKFFTVAPTVDMQNDLHVCSRASDYHDVMSQPTLATRPTFSKSLMVSIAVSKLNCLGLMFVNPGAKITGSYYCDELLLK